MPRTDGELCRWDWRPTVQIEPGKPRHPIATTTTELLLQDETGQ